MARGDVHVHRFQNVWRVAVEGFYRAGSLHRTQREARRAGRDLARRIKSQLLVYGRNHQVRERNSYVEREPRRHKG
jgi:hypothetical protein